jgi:uncharacterized coiled-coil DUF342 family protein
MNKEGIEIMSDMNLEIQELKQQIEKLKQKYNKFKKEVSSHIFEEIIENVPTDPDYIENYWEDNFDNFIEEFEEEWDDV